MNWSLSQKCRQKAVNLDYNVQLNRTAVLKQENREIVLELKANEHFILPFEYQVQSGNDTTTVIRYRIIFSDRFTVAPESWDEDSGRNSPSKSSN